MLLHIPNRDKHPENPNRIHKMIDMFQEMNLHKRCLSFKVNYFFVLYIT